MEQNSALLIAFVSGAIALIGSLGSQLISASASLKAKKMDMVYGRKAETYAELIKNAGAFCQDTTNDEKYNAFLYAYLATVIIASPKVLESLSSKEGLTNAAVRLRQAQGKEQVHSECFLKRSNFLYQTKCARMIPDEYRGLPALR